MVINLSERAGRRVPCSGHTGVAVFASVGCSDKGALIRQEPVPSRYGGLGKARLGRKVDVGPSHALPSSEGAAPFSQLDRDLGPRVPTGRKVPVRVIRVAVGMEIFRSRESQKEVRFSISGWSSVRALSDGKELHVTHDYNYQYYTTTQRGTYLPGTNGKSVHCLC